MDMVWIQQSLPFNKQSFNFKDLIKLNTIREPLVILCCCCYCFNYQFLNQKLQTVGLTKSQGLGMQKQIQGTDELQMWTGFRGFNRLSRVCQVTETFFLGGCMCTFVSLCFLFVLNTADLSQNSQEQLLHATIKKNTPQTNLFWFIVCHLQKNKTNENDLLNKQSLITTTCF